VANYFSDTLSIVELSGGMPNVVSVPLGPQREWSLERKGEFYFHDGTICDQSWQSCSSCHPDGRADGLNWDLLNDGVDNPKNTKSLVQCFQTPPMMWLGVRETAPMAVRAGLRHILFSKQDEEVAKAMEAYLQWLQPEVSPHLRRMTNGEGRGGEGGGELRVSMKAHECHELGDVEGKGAGGGGTGLPGAGQTGKSALRGGEATLDTAQSDSFRVSEFPAAKRSQTRDAGVDGGAADRNVCGTADSKVCATGEAAVRTPQSTLRSPKGWALSDSAKRGEKVFGLAGCADCHTPGLYTDLLKHDVGTRAACDKPTDEFDTPSLVELWRTGPYLHDGSAATVREAITIRNSHDQHGKTSNLSAREIEELCEFLLSL
jgi:hypothetical protein